MPEIVWGNNAKTVKSSRIRLNLGKKTVCNKSMKQILEVGVLF